VTTSGWVFHTIQAPFKKDKDGNPTLGTRGRILLATRKNSFTISEKIHHHSDLYQTATWNLSAGEFISLIHITGVYLSPDNKVPTSGIKDLYTTLNSNFHTPSPHSPQVLHCHHYHILTGDFNSWVDMEHEEHLANHLGFPHIPIRVGDPHPRRQPQDCVPSSASTTTHAHTRGRLLVDFLNHHTLIIANDRFLPSPSDSTHENQKKHPPFSSHHPTTIYDTIVDYFIVSKIITPDITQCTTHSNSWHSLPPIHPIRVIAEKPGQRYPVRTDHNLISISLVLPSHPPLGSSHFSDEQRPVRQAYHSWKLKYGNTQISLKEDLDLNASSILPTLKDILDNTKNLSPQARANKACKLVGSVLHESASSVLSSPNFQPQHTHSRQPPPATFTHPPGHKHTILPPTQKHCTPIFKS